MNKHMPYDLAQMQSLPLSAKITMTKQRIKGWYEHFDGQVYVSFSGGKDSTVLKHIVDSIYSDVPAVFVNTGLEYPEIQNFVKQIKSGKYDCFNSDVEIVRPEMRFDEVIKKYGATRISVNPQTLNDDVLKVIGRLHTGEDTVNAFRIARKIGFDNINMDLIAGLPTESPESFKNSLDRVIELDNSDVKEG